MLPARPARRVAGSRLRAAALMLLAAILCGCGLSGQDGAGYAQTRNGITFWAQPRPLPPTRFTDAGGNFRSLADFRGKLVLLNVWATWCAPCREEMPSLDRLQAELGGDSFAVVAVSVDHGAAKLVERFYADFGIRHLGTYVDAGSGASVALNAPGIPITLILDRDGREIGRKLGSAAWDSPKMVRLLRDLIDVPRPG